HLPDARAGRAERPPDPERGVRPLRVAAPERRPPPHPRGGPRDRRRAGGGGRARDPRVPGGNPMSRHLQFFHFGLMPYHFIPDGTQIESSWVTLSNKYYDPEIGHRLYREYLDQAGLGARLGYEGRWGKETN